MDKLSEDKSLDGWIDLGSDKGRLQIVLDAPTHDFDAGDIFGSTKNDHKIINVARLMQVEHPDTQVSLVTKDINLRIKAKAIGVNSEDYKTGRVDDVVDLSDTFSSALNDLDAEIIKKLYEDKRIAENGILQESKSGKWLLYPEQLQSKCPGAI